LKKNKNIKIHKDMNNEVKKKSGKKIIWGLLLTLLLAGGAGIGFYFVWRSAGYFVTDNARVTTTLIAITPDVPGRLERFTAFEGSRVQQNEILGWVENGEVMRSPVDGLVIHSDIVQGQMVSPMESVAVIADINRIHVLANVEEDDIRRIRVGQSAIVTIDPFGNREFSGYVSEVGLITTSELSGTALFFNTGGNFTRVTHLIPIKITIVDNDIALENFIGVNARVRIPLRQTVSQPVALSPTAQQNATRISISGNVESVKNRNVYTTMGAIIERVNVEVGDVVRKGQVLAVLETAELRSQLASAEATLRMAEVNLATAQHNYSVFSELSATGSVPRDNVQQLEFALQTALAYRQQAQAMLNAVRVHLDRSTLTSPINGTVTKVIAQEGEIGMGRMFVVEDTENLKIVTRFREHDLSRISVGMGVAIVPKGNTNVQYVGAISRINPTAMAFSPIVEFETEIRVTSINSSLRIGMNVDVVLE